MQSIDLIPEIGTSVENSNGYSYKILKTLPSPVSNSVFLGVDVFEKSYALHAFKAPNLDEETAKLLWIKETYALRSLFHPSLAYVHDTFEYKSQYYLVTEVLSKPLSSLAQGLPRLSDTQILAIARDLFFGLSFVHWHQIIHGDLNLDTVRFDLSGSYVKMTDFGVDMAFEPLLGPSSQGRETPILPNLNFFGYTNEQSDLFMTGLILLALKTGKPVFDKVPSFDDVQRLTGEGYPAKIAESLGSALGKKLANLMAKPGRFPYLSAVHAWSDFRDLLKYPRFH